jgi:hypothetical protein
MRRLKATFKLWITLAIDTTSWVIRPRAFRRQSMSAWLKTCMHIFACRSSHLPLSRCAYPPLPASAQTRRLEWAGACAPPGEHQAETDRLEDAGKSTNGHRIQRAFLRKNLGNELEHVSQISSRGLEHCSGDHDRWDVRWVQRKLGRSSHRGRQLPCS